MDGDCGEDSPIYTGDQGLPVIAPSSHSLVHNVSAEMMNLNALLICASIAVAVPTIVPLISTVPTLRGVEDSEPLPQCLATSSPCLFEISNIAYQKYEPFLGTIDQGMDTMTMAFSVANNGNDVETACSFINGKYLGQWTDNGTKWFPCGNRTLLDETGTKYIVRTSAQFQWDTWNLAINQTWACEDGYEQQ